MKMTKQIGKDNGCWKGFVNMYNFDMGFVRQFECLREAVDWIKINTKYTKAVKSCIQRVCKEYKSNSSSYGYKWQYSKKEMLK